MRKLSIFAICFALAFFYTHLHAHHSSTATFKTDAPISIDGVVKKYSFRNPHVVFYLDVTNASGETAEWMVEGPSATILRRQGWSKETLKVGNRVRVGGDSTRDGSLMVWLTSAAMLDVKTGMVTQALQVEDIQDYEEEEFIAMNLPEKLSDGRPNLTGLWHGKGSPYESPRDPDVPFNKPGRALQNVIRLDHDPQIFCEPPGLIRQAGMTHYGIRIAQLDDRIVLDYEEYGGHREVYFDDRDAKGVHSHFGDSIARYEGDTLIIETINLLPDMATAEGNRLSTEALVIQKFKRVDEAKYGAMMSMETVVTDPVFLAEPFILSNIKVAVADEAFIESSCTPPLRDRTRVNPFMNFFLTSEGLNENARSSGIKGANAHCKKLASKVGKSSNDWRAYVTVSGDVGGNNNVDRIGVGPWYDANGIPVAKSLNELRDGSSRLTEASIVDEHGRAFEDTASTPDISMPAELTGRFYCFCD